MTESTGNCARIINLPGKEGVVRGYSSAALIAIDEANRVSDDCYLASCPMLAVSVGFLVALSTPWGKRGWWHKEWTEGGNGWGRYKESATTCPRIPAVFLAEERRSMGPLWFASEYLYQHFFSQKMRPFVDYIRKPGNEANHEISPNTEQDATAAIEVVAALLRHNYEVPGRLPTP